MEDKFSVYCKLSLRRNGRSIRMMEVEMPSDTVETASKLSRPIADALIKAAVNNSRKREVEHG